MQNIDHDIEEYRPSQLRIEDGFDHIEWAQIGDRQDYECTAEQAGLLMVGVEVINA